MPRRKEPKIPDVQVQLLGQKSEVLDFFNNINALQ
jgi:hypothetical protein